MGRLVTPSEWRSIEPKLDALARLTPIVEAFYPAILDLPDGAPLGRPCLFASTAGDLRRAVAAARGAVRSIGWDAWETGRVARVRVVARPHARCTRAARVLRPWLRENLRGGAHVRRCKTALVVSCQFAEDIVRVRAWAKATVPGLPGHEPYRWWEDEGVERFVVRFDRPDRPAHKALRASLTAWCRVHLKKRYKVVTRWPCTWVDVHCRDQTDAGLVRMFFG